MSERETVVRLDDLILFFDLAGRQLAVLPRLAPASAHASACANLPPCVVTFGQLEALLCHELTPRKEAP